MAKQTTDQLSMFAAPVPEETLEDKKRRSLDLRGRAGELFVQLGECTSPAEEARLRERIKALDAEADAILPKEACW